MKLRKVTAASAAALVLALTATACGGDDDKSDSGSGGGDKIKVGIKFDQPGIGLKEPDGSFSGFDVDVATYVAKQLGYAPDKIEWVETKSADRETALARGDVKFIAASYSINDKRKAKVDFSQALPARPPGPARQDGLQDRQGHGPQRQEPLFRDRLHLGTEHQGHDRPEGQPA